MKRLDNAVVISSPVNTSGRLRLPIWNWICPSCSWTPCSLVTALMRTNSNTHNSWGTQVTTSSEASLIQSSVANLRRVLFAVRPRAQGTAAHNSTDDTTHMHGRCFPFHDRFPFHCRLITLDTLCSGAPASRVSAFRSSIFILSTDNA